MHLKDVEFKLHNSECCILPNNAPAFPLSSSGHKLDILRLVVHSKRLGPTGLRC